MFQFLNLAIFARYNLYYKQETQLSLTNRATRLEGQSRSPNMVPFAMLGMVSY